MNDARCLHRDESRISRLGARVTRSNVSYGISDGRTDQNRLIDSSTGIDTVTSQANNTSGADYRPVRFDEHL
jgi:hypothetical protein